jgi:hypothetical protein
LPADQLKVHHGRGTAYGQALFQVADGHLSQMLKENLGSHLPSCPIPSVPVSPAKNQPIPEHFAIRAS